MENEALWKAFAVENEANDIFEVVTIADVIRNTNPNHQSFKNVSKIFENIYNQGKICEDLTWFKEISQTFNDRISSVVYKAKGEASKYPEGKSCFTMFTFRSNFTK